MRCITRTAKQSEKRNRNSLRSCDQKKTSDATTKTRIIGRSATMAARSDTANLTQSATYEKPDTRISDPASRLLRVVHRAYAGHARRQNTAPTGMARNPRHLRLRRSLPGEHANRNRNAREREINEMNFQILPVPVLADPEHKLTLADVKAKRERALGERILNPTPPMEIPQDRTLAAGKTLLRIAADYTTRANYQTNYAKANRERMREIKRAWRARQKAKKLSASGR